MNCVVCGADVAKSRIRRDEIIGKGCDTCDPICTRAKHGNRTRTEQIWLDDQEDQLREEQEIRDFGKRL